MNAKVSEKQFNLVCVSLIVSFLTFGFFYPFYAILSWLVIGWIGILLKGGLDNIVSYALGLLIASIFGPIFTFFIILDDHNLIAYRDFRVTVMKDDIKHEINKDWNKYGF